MNNTDLVTLVRAIVSGQKQIIGPMAVDEANKVQGVAISKNLDSIELKGEGDHLLENLVHQYEKLFGLASIEACREAVKKVLPSITNTHLPDFLK